ncbi:MAG: poly-gamma-glutamate biosynthesis protein PgsC, partial [Oscillospiraceae bacterium]
MYNEIIVLGVVVSLLYAELTGLSPAGLVVPGYIALCLKTPARIAYTLVVVLITWGLARLLGNVMILYGRRRFAVMVLLSFAVSFLLGNSPLLPYDPGVIGCLVPGIIAQEFEKQGILKSLVSLGIVVGILSLAMLA